MCIDFKVEEFSSAYEEAVISLIVKIQREEYQIDIGADDQPDLRSINQFYQSQNGNFWVAIHNGEVIGTIALLDIGEGNVALRKMFVQIEYRGPHHGVAKRLLQEAIDWSNDKQVQSIYLGTTSKFLAAHRFYEKNRFKRIDKSLLPESFPIMKVDSIFFEYQVENQQALKEAQNA